jgi:hypothetical protein
LPQEEPHRAENPPGVPDDPLLTRLLEARERIREEEADLSARREFRAALVAAHEGGHSYTAIGRAVGVTPPTRRRNDPRRNLTKSVAPVPTRGERRPVSTRSGPPQGLALAADSKWIAAGSRLFGISREPQWLGGIGSDALGSIRPIGMRTTRRRSWVSCPCDPPDRAGRARTLSGRFSAAEDQRPRSVPERCWASLQRGVSARACPAAREPWPFFMHCKTPRVAAHDPRFPVLVTLALHG